VSLRVLQAGDVVGVIAPAGPVSADALSGVPALYAKHGLRVRLFPACHQQTGYLAGSDAMRLADVHAALRDDEVVALHCLRGGYGAMRLLDGIDEDLVRRQQKLLIGYSDITALHALWARVGLPSLHAPMPASDLIKPGRQADEAALFALLQRGWRAGDVIAPLLQPDAHSVGLHVPGAAEGLLIGGNLSLVGSLLGTRWAWDATGAGRGAILFLEDVSEDLYRVDRWLTQLRLSGMLNAVRGFVIGSFTEAESPMPLLKQMLVPLNKPLLAGWPTGHGTPNLPLPMGVRVRLDATAGTLTLQQEFLHAK
jgi:muramoyltetrapeptide carboxypeptidase